MYSALQINTSRQGRNQLGGRGDRPPPPVKSWGPGKMWLFIVIARRKYYSSLVFSLFNKRVRNEFSH